jgi:hypothetical protein
MKSKRFIAFAVGVSLFLLMTYTTKYHPMELAGAISVICGIYIGAETFRKSDSQEKT